ncbi:MAG TPA: type IV secretory system conjugative DNA transfer family protein [Candidatus Wunengus sp. YC60]|uniref:type IV secretory system conjugative DNA transfer family protein n=1 Tax=Candidatus Wunengus sp. YC60 TaxID=3367697 RepID=UPI0040293A5D
MFKNNVVIDLLQKEGHILDVYFSQVVFPPITHLLLQYFVLIAPYLLVLTIIAVTLLIVLVVLRLWLLYRESLKPHTFLEITPLAHTRQSSFTTTQLFTTIHGLARQRSWIQRFFGISKNYSFELVSTKTKGIRYIVRLPVDDSEIIKKNLIAYLPGINIKDVDDYLPASKTEGSHIIEVRITKHFAYPLKKQENLQEYDPIAHITATMTKLAKNELVAFQVVVSPADSQSVPEIQKLRLLFLEQKDILSYVSQKHGGLGGVFFFVLAIALRILILPIGILVFLASNGREGPFMPLPGSWEGDTKHNAYKEFVEGQIKQKVDQQLFVTSIRLYTAVDEYTARRRIEKGFIAALSPFTNAGFQSLRAKRHVPISPFENLKNYLFTHRLPDILDNSVLSTSEISDLYHFPYTDTTKTEDMIKVHSKELPAPLSLKNSKDLDVVFGKNTYGNVTTNIGLTDEDRSRHVYMIGQTGSGKSTIIYHMASDDIQKGRGVAVVDPHGDLAEDLMATVPQSRMNDFIYFNPFDVKHPVGINLLELTPTLDEDDKELEKELVCESVISIFRKVFSKDDNVDAHRIEYILRNTIYTAFTVKDPTIFTVYDLLNNPDFQKEALKGLEDENLLNFWKNEFGKAGNYQVVKMVSGVTARVGRFLFSPTAKRILEQPHSTINFNEILTSGKILLCNLAEGKIGEDTSQLLGTTIIAKIQQAALRRARIDSKERSPFYLFIDEFQNFATAPFTKLLSGGRKFGLRITIAEQSTSQQSDRNVVNVILANTGTVISFRTASPVDEVLMLPQFAPYVTEEDIANLPRYHFFIKLSAVEPEEPFSGITLPILATRDQEKIDKLIEASRKNYAITYQKPTSVTKIAPEVKQWKKKGSGDPEAQIATLIQGEK